MSVTGSSSSKSFKLPLWAQIGAGLTLVALIFLILKASVYVSAWDEEDSNLFESAKQALQMRGISPSAPTAFIFWEKDCSTCPESIRAFSGLPSNLRIYGIFISKEKISEIDVRNQWLRLSPKASLLVFDRDEMLKSSFRVRSTPTVFVYLPKQKTIYSYLGNIDHNRERMLEIIASE